MLVALPILVVMSSYAGDEFKWREALAWRSRWRT